MEIRSSLVGPLLFLLLVVQCLVLMRAEFTFQFKINRNFMCFYPFCLNIKPNANFPAFLFSIVTFYSFIVIFVVIQFILTVIWIGAWIFDAAIDIAEAFSGVYIIYDSYAWQSHRIYFGICIMIHHFEMEMALGAILIRFKRKINVLMKNLNNSFLYFIRRKFIFPGGFV